MKISKSTPKSRRHRNAQANEGKEQQPFFSKSSEPPIQKKEDSAFFQPKLKIGAPNDKYEKEADKMADSVVNKSNNSPDVQSKEISSIQRYMTNSKEDELGTNTERMEKDKAIQEKPEIQRMDVEEEESVQMMEEEESIQQMEEEESVQMMEEEEEAIQEKEEEEPVQMMEEEESIQQMEEEESVQMMEEEEEAIQEKEEEEALQTKSNSGGGNASPQVANQINASKGKGSALPDKTNQEMSGAFGYDFSGVKIHNNSEAENMNKELGAQAFTHGKDVYFNSGKYSPESNEGKKLLAHELTHVVQQKGDIMPKIQRKPDTVENVNVTKEEDKKKATAIIARIKSTYGIDVDSPAGVDAIKKDYSSVPKSVLNNLKTKKWELKELVALEKALVHFAPILGGNRKDSSRKNDDQEITSVSAVEQGIDEDEATGSLDTTTMGEYFEDSRNFSMFKEGTDSTQDFADNDKQLEGTAIHEIAHGLLKYALSDFVSTFDYWLDEDTKSGKKDVEAPITNYGMESAAEDFSEAAMFFFMNPKKLKDGRGKTKGEAGNPCPERFAFMEKVVAAWKPKKKSP